MQKTKKYILITLVSLLLPVFLLAGSNIPAKPESWVSDYANVLSSREEQNLDQRLNGLESGTSNQVFIAIFTKIPEGEYLDDYVNKVFTKWRPGLKDKNNGLLIAIFINDHKMRIETGYGVEDVVTDAQANTIIEDVLVPYFRKNQYYHGLDAALDQIIPALEGKFKIPVKKKETTGKKIPGFIIVLILFFVLVKFLGGGGSSGYGTRRRGSILGPMIIGSMLGGGSSSGGSFGGGGGFSGGFGGMSGGGGASGGW